MTRRHIWINAALGGVLAFLAAFGGLGAMVTGLKLRADLEVLALGCGLMALAFSACFAWKLWLLPLCLEALLLGFWWQQGILPQSFGCFLNRFSQLLHKGYGLEQLQLPAGPEANAALLVLALPVVLAVAGCCARGRFTWLGVTVTLLPLGSCMLLKDTVPGAGWIFSVLFCALLLMLTGGVRRRDLAQSNRLTAVAGAALAVALGLLFLLCPRETYRGQAGAQWLEEQVLALGSWERIPTVEELLGGTPPTVALSPQRTKLENLGPRVLTGREALRLRADSSGLLYLRGQSYDTYTKTGWEATLGREDLSFPRRGDAQLHAAEVEEKVRQSLTYFSYAPLPGAGPLEGGRLPHGESRYILEYLEPVEIGDIGRVSGPKAPANEETYLDLPDHSRRGGESTLRRSALKISLDTPRDTWETALAITRWVRDQASYDLNTPRMPEGREDFALWFLNESDTGYCVHYASAAAVLLRAAGIPARYVTGYAVRARADRWVSVTDAQAHAWVEAYIPEVGWVALDPTPADYQNDRPPEQRPPEPTEPKPTEPKPTEPEPSEPTEPEPSAGPPPVTDPTEGTAGVASQGGAEPPKSVSGGGPLPALLGVLALCAGLPVLAVGQWRLRLWLDRRRMHRGGPNGRALARYRHLERLCARLGEAPPEECLALAQKARFSQHTLENAELAVLKSAQEARIRALEEKNWLTRLACRLVWALY